MNISTPPSAYNRANPFKARLTANYALSGEGSNKDTRHMVLNLGASGLSYAPLPDEVKQQDVQTLGQLTANGNPIP